MKYQERSKFRPATSFLLSFFLAMTALASAAMGPVVYADPAVDPVADPADQSDTQLSDDTDPPVVTTNIIDNQVLAGTVPIVETVYDTNPQEYAIKILDTNGMDVMVNGLPVGAILNPASGTELTFNWDTTTVANGQYKIVLSASDQAANSFITTVQVSVANQPTPPVYPPITPELTPIPQQAVTPPHLTAPKTTPPPPSQPQPTEILGARTDKLVHSMPQTAATQPHLQDLPDTCAKFFGVCWYYSVPATTAISAGALWLYRLRNRE